MVTTRPLRTCSPSYVVQNARARRTGSAPCTTASISALARSLSRSVLSQSSRNTCSGMPSPLPNDLPMYLGVHWPSTLGAGGEGGKETVALTWHGLDEAGCPPVVLQARSQVPYLAVHD